MRGNTTRTNSLSVKKKWNPYQAANMGANRVLKKIKELEPRVKSLDDQLTAISTKVNDISKQLAEIDKSVKEKGKNSGTGQATQ